MADYEVQRHRMVEEQLVPRGIRDRRVLDAMRRVPRERFCPGCRDPYADAAQAIGSGQTISQPYVVARMTELLAVRPGMSVLELGTGSGYQAAVLAEMGADVYTTERHAELHEHAKAALAAAGYTVHLHLGDGTLGWPDDRTFDRILCTAASPDILSRLLKSQLADDGRAVIPAGTRESQRLVSIHRQGEQFQRIDHDLVVFVPLIGEEGWRGN